MAEKIVAGKVQAAPAPRVEDNGVCPACGRADSVKQAPPTELYSRESSQRFTCTGCQAVWAGVRR